MSLGNESFADKSRSNFITPRDQLWIDILAIVQMVLPLILDLE